MLLAAILLMCPFPQTGDAAQTLVNRAPSAITVSVDTKGDSSVSQPLPSVPQPKIKTDAALAADSIAAPVTPNYAAMSIQPVKHATERPYESPRQRKIWYVLSISGSGAAAFDAWSTRRALSRNDGTESNPLLRPFAHSGALYVATQATPLLMDFLGKRMMVSQHPWVRKMWWLPQSAGTGLSLAAGSHNVGIVP
ncbi:MAG TPA: hypothetical protein VGI16_06045 [Candidatus Acidoferrum sp.]|jgi:hypothetical protein